MKLLLSTEILPRLTQAAKALLKHPDAIDISVSQFLELWGPKKIRTFVSIGANDGVKNDPLNKFIHAYDWGGVMVEPSPDNFRRLRANFQDNKRIILENSGISDIAATMRFYRVREVTEAEPDWYDQVASFDKATFLRNISVEPRLASRIAVEDVSVITFEMLMERHGLQQADLIMIDAEGYDSRILLSIDLERYRPAVIVFEHEWLTNYDTRMVRNLLKRNGYRSVLCGLDCVAFRPSA